MAADAFFKERWFLSSGRHRFALVGTPRCGVRSFRVDPSDTAARRPYQDGLETAAP